jgi:NitT/TauT family transport system substrate-binding protein
MRKQRNKGAIVATVVLSFIAAACGSDDDDSSSASTPAADTAAAPADTEAPADTQAPADTAAPTGTDGAAGTAEECTTPDPVRFQMQWVTQAQFAGYVAALDQGFYEAQCLDVTILEGAVDIVPQTVLANGDADFAITWVPKALASREAGANIVDIAQVYQRSGTLQISFKDKNITSPSDFAGKKVGNWGFGNEWEVFAAMTKAGIDPADVENIAQQFDMVAFLEGDIDAAEAMTYNELAQVMEAINPDTGELYTADDLNIINYEEEGVGMLQDSIWADGARLSDPAYEDMAVRFVAASLQGWAYCRDNADECAQLVTDKNTILPLTHQKWQMNEVNKLIWPAESGVGFIDPEAWDRTAKLSQETKNAEGGQVLTKAPDSAAYTNDIVTAAHALLEEMGIDLVGADFAPATVTLTEGGV